MDPPKSKWDTRTNWSKMKKKKKKKKIKKTQLQGNSGSSVLRFFVTEWDKWVAFFYVIIYPSHVTYDIYKSPKNATILSHVGKRM